MVRYRSFVSHTASTWRADSTSPGIRAKSNPNTNEAAGTASKTALIHEFAKSADMAPVRRTVAANTSPTPASARKLTYVAQPSRTRYIRWPTRLSSDAD